MKHKFLVPFDQNHCFHLGPAILPDGSPNYDEQVIMNTTLVVMMMMKVNHADDENDNDVGW
eukprot:392859-Pleurochrysis_carterae.AAC.1